MADPVFDGLQFATEKITEGYLPHYQRIAAVLGMHARVCEVGVRGGDSLRLWQTLFPRGDIAGVDINPDAVWPEGTTRIVAGQADYGLADAVGERDLIVDDASHKGPLTARTLDLLWPCLRPGGYYVIEDWWFEWGMKDSMLAMVQNLLPLLKRPDFDSITYRWGLVIIRKAPDGAA